MGEVVPFPKPIVSAKSDIEAAIERDQWDRPKIIPVGGGKSVSYRRASTIAEALEDHFGLEAWKRRLTAEGLAQRPDLVQAIHTASKKEVGQIVEQAIEHAGGGSAARNGSTMHALTERLDNGDDLPPGLPSNIVAMLEKYEQVTSRLEVIDTERFVVCDAIQAAGTYDRRLAFQGDIFIGDLKTGQNLNYLALKTCAQVAVYAAGDLYSLDGEREPHGANKDRGLFIHLPWTDDPSEATCELRWLDLRVGRKAIQEARRMETFRKLNAEQLLPRVR